MKAVRPRKYYDFEREMREKVSPQKVRDEVSPQLLCGENVPGTTVSLDRERERESMHRTLPTSWEIPVTAAAKLMACSLAGAKSDLKHGL